MKIKVEQFFVREIELLESAVEEYLKKHGDRRLISCSYVNRVMKYIDLNSDEKDWHYNFCATFEIIGDYNNG